MWPFLEEWGTWGMWWDVVVSRGGSRSRCEVDAVLGQMVGYLG